MPLPKFQLYSRKEYFDSLTGHAKRAVKGGSITVMSMDFEPQEPNISRLMQALCAAASRGVEVRLVIDAINFLMSPAGKPGPLWYGRDFLSTTAEPFRSTVHRLKELELHGGKYWILNLPNRPFTNPVSGRSHMKLALVNDTVYIGGCNLRDASETDIMASWEDSKTATWLYGITRKITEAGTARQAFGNQDQTHVINDMMTIFVDCGVKKQSVIYGQALAYIDDAKSKVYITCQYFPGGPTAQHLLAAKNRGVEVTILYNGPKAHDQALGQYLYNLRERSRLPADFFKLQLPDGTPKLHAKLIATEHGAMLGSHNFINIGVNLGTAEIVLRVDDPAFAEAAIAKINSLTNGI